MTQPPKKSLSRRTRIKSRSDAKRATDYLYTKKRKVFLRLRTMCELCGTRASQDVHHRRGRYGSAFLDEKTWMALCRLCHDWIHQHPKEARELGLFCPLSTRELMQERAAR